MRANSITTNARTAGVISASSSGGIVIFLWFALMARTIAENADYGKTDFIAPGCERLHFLGRLPNGIMVTCHGRGSVTR